MGVARTVSGSIHICLRGGSLTRNVRSHVARRPRLSARWTTRRLRVDAWAKRFAPCAIIAVMAAEDFDLGWAEDDAPTTARVAKEERPRRPAQSLRLRVQTLLSEDDGCRWVIWRRPRGNPWPPRLRLVFIAVKAMHQQTSIGDGAVGRPRAVGRLLITQVEPLDSALDGRPHQREGRSRRRAHGNRRALLWRRWLRRAGRQVLEQGRWAAVRRRRRRCFCDGGWRIVPLMRTGMWQRRRRWLRSRPPSIAWRRRRRRRGWRGRGVRVACVPCEQLV